MSKSSRKLLQYKEVLDLFPLHLRNEIYARAEYRDCKRNEQIFRRGEVGTFMAGVMSGRLRMSVSSLEGKEMLITMIERGELFGEMSVLDDLVRAVDVVTETECTLMVIKQEDFIPILRSSPDAMLGLVKLTCHRMRTYVQMMELIALQSLPVRIARYLLLLARDYGNEADGRITITANLSQMDIGHQLACSRESVNKQLHAFEDKGLLFVQGDSIILCDVEGLKKAITPMSH